MISKFWLSIWAGVLSIGWLLPNHYYPWLSFHMDGWISISLLIVSAVVIWRSNKPVPIHRFVLTSFSLLAIPGLQTLFGLIELPGVAWTSTAYIAGFGFALIVGAQWESNQSGQLGDGLFLAIGIAALVSVGLQLQQWLQIDGIELWKMGGRPGRPYANFGQPNQLGTFLLWGLLAVGWGWIRHRIGDFVAILMAGFLLFGVALTASRTAWIGLAVIVISAWYWRKLWANPRLPLAFTGLVIYFILLITVRSWQGIIMQADLPVSPVSILSHDYFSTVAGDYRLSAWIVFSDAIWHHPWFGYGWYQVVPAQLALAAEHPSLQGVFTSTHNLFLDLFIWCGIPLGLAISIALLFWGWRKINAVRHAEEVILMLFLAVVVNHAMLELPLHYAYFLLPVGLVIGVLNTRMGETPLFFLPRWTSMGMWFIVTLLLLLIIRDYVRVETSHENFRMEKMQIKVAHLPPPDVLLLTQWHEYIVVAYTEPKRGMTPSEIDRVRKVANFFAGPLFIHKLAKILALNNQAEDAKLWLVRLCKSSPGDYCDTSKFIWKSEAKQHPEIAAIPWPEPSTPD